MTWWPPVSEPSGTASAIIPDVNNADVWWEGERWVLAEDSVPRITLGPEQAFSEHLLNK